MPDRHGSCFPIAAVEGRCVSCGQGVYRTASGRYRHGAGMGATRVCSDCHRERPIEEFRSNGQRRKWRCRDCQRPIDQVHNRASKARNHDRELERLRPLGRTPKARARNRLRNAVQSGRVTKPDACQSCGKSGPVQGHHHDYDQPLDVRWLCRLCHEEVHRQLRRLRHD